VSNFNGHYNTAAILEWIVALVYTFYVLSFFMDFIPAIHSKQGRQSHETVEQMAARESGFDGSTLGRESHLEDGYTGGRHYGNGYNANVQSANGYAKPAPGTF
jgi:hypothetical protein